MSEVIINFTELVASNAPVVKEAWFMPYNMEVFIMLVLGLVLAWLFHEAMHYITANKYKLSPVYGWDHKGSFVSLKRIPSYHQQLMIIENAVLMGLLPLLVCFYIVGLWVLIPTLIYLLGCNSDLSMDFKIRGIIKRFRR